MPTLTHPQRPIAKAARPRRSAPWKLALLAAVSAIACGGPDRDDIEGTWLFSDFPMSKPCVEELDFDQGTVTSSLFCVLKEDRVGHEVTVGAYTREDTKVTVNAVQSTCPTRSRAPVVWYVIADRRTLKKTIGTVTQTFQRDGAKTRGVTVSGCFDANIDRFEEHRLTMLP